MKKKSQITLIIIIGLVIAAALILSTRFSTKKDEVVIIDASSVNLESDKERAYFYIDMCLKRTVEKAIYVEGLRDNILIKNYIQKNLVSDCVREYAPENQAGGFRLELPTDSARIIPTVTLNDKTVAVDLLMPVSLRTEGSSKTNFDRFSFLLPLALSYEVKTDEEGYVIDDTVINSADQKLTIIIPRGAQIMFSEGPVVNLELFINVEQAELPQMIGETQYKIFPEDVYFSKDIQVIFSEKREAMPENNKIIYLKNGHSYSLPTFFEPSTDTYMAFTNHFSIYALYNCGGSDNKPIQVPKDKETNDLANCFLHQVYPRLEKAASGIYGVSQIDACHTPEQCGYKCEDGSEVKALGDGTFSCLPKQSVTPSFLPGMESLDGKKLTRLRIEEGDHYCQSIQHYLTTTNEVMCCPRAVIDGSDTFILLYSRYGFEGQDEVKFEGKIGEFDSSALPALKYIDTKGLTEEKFYSNLKASSDRDNEKTGQEKKYDEIIKEEITGTNVPYEIVLATIAFESKGISFPSQGELCNDNDYCGLMGVKETACSDNSECDIDKFRLGSVKDQVIPGISTLKNDINYLEGLGLSRDKPSFWNFLGVAYNGGQYTAKELLNVIKTEKGLSSINDATWQHVTESLTFNKDGKIENGGLIKKANPDWNIDKVNEAYTAGNLMLYWAFIFKSTADAPVVPDTCEGIEFYNEPQAITPSTGVEYGTNMYWTGAVPLTGTGDCAQKPGPQPLVNYQSATDNELMNLFGQNSGQVWNNAEKVTILNKEVNVHKCAAPAFRRVAVRLENLKSNYGLNYDMNKILGVDGTGTINWRRIKKPSDPAGATGPLSWHSFGIAIDINPVYNPRCGVADKKHYCKGSNDFITDMPVCFVNAWKAEGFQWGGDFDSRDPMHFEWQGWKVPGFTCQLN
ncbi:MAG: M15 family metallopeptidase [archaeon]